MNITVRQSKIRTIRSDDPNFMLVDGASVWPRAGFEIVDGCPDGYKCVIVKCIESGWLKPVAHVYGKEITMDSLR
jgi:hypothetical protein